MYTFLSPEWIAAVREIRAQHQPTDPEIGVEIRINLDITDTPFDDGAAAFHLDTSGGSVTIAEGHLDDVDAVITTDYELARQLLLDGDGQQFMQAFLEGRIRVQGDMTKLLLLQATMAQSASAETAGQVAAEVQSITAP